MRESEEVASIVEDLLVASRMDRGQMNMASDAVRLDEELCSIVEVCDVDVEPIRIEPLTVLGDSIRIHQISRNLITNADRYGGDHVTVSVFADGPEAVLAVRDNGPGIPADALPHIFEPFYTTKKVGTGSGLGLSVSRKIVDLHGALIDIRNSPSGGLEALLIFAVAPAPSAVPPVDPVPAAEPDPTGTD